MTYTVESKTRTHYGPVGSGRRIAGRRGGAKLGRTGRRRVDLARKQPSLLRSSESKTLSWTTLRKHAQTKFYLNRIVESKTRTYHGRAGSGRTEEWRSGVAQDWMPTELFAQETWVSRTFQRIEHTSPECFSRSTNKQNPM